jgi:bifunctional DNA-binding transcriptional regulator/antitoxin component of YhaV-PrlF toxin-antitoxin module
MAEPIRETLTLQPDGRLVVPDAIRQALNVKGLKAFCQIEVYGKDKALITILTRWEPRLAHRQNVRTTIKKK